MNQKDYHNYKGINDFNNQNSQRNIFYQKYCKYKVKYFELKKQIGGMIFSIFLFKYENEDDFVTDYDKRKIEGKNSFQIFIEIIKDFGHTPKPYNILVGANSISDSDYFRFKDSDFYSLYMDNNYGRIENSIRQYHMYTLFYDDFESNYSNFSKNSVNEIHFDTGSAYFTPIKYLEIAQHILKPNGKIIWDLMDHLSIIYLYSITDRHFYDTNGRLLSNLNELLDENHLILDLINQTILPKDDNYFLNNSMAPQIKIQIKYIENLKKSFKNQPYYGFLDYLRRNYINLSFEEKTYSFQNYSYPVPIRYLEDNFFIDVYDEVINFIVNIVMNLEERKDYIRLKILTSGKIGELIARVLFDKELEISFLDIHQVKTNGVNKDKIQDYIYERFYFEWKFIEATKLD